MPYEIKCGTEEVGEREGQKTAIAGGRKYCIDCSWANGWLLGVRVKHEREREREEEKKRCKGREAETEVVVRFIDGSEERSGEVERKESGGRGGTDAFLCLRQRWTALPSLYHGLHYRNSV